MNKVNSSEIIVISHSTVDKNQVIAFSGNLVFNNAQLAKEKIYENFVDADGYILDFSKVTRIDSAGFGVIFNFMSKKPRTSAVVAVVRDSFILELFNVTKVDQIIPLCGSVDEAVEIIDFIMAKR